MTPEQIYMRIRNSTETNPHEQYCAANRINNVRSHYIAPTLLVNEGGSKKSKNNAKTRSNGQGITEFFLI